MRVSRENGLRLLVPDELDFLQDGSFGHDLQEKISEGVCLCQLVVTPIGEKLG